MIKRVFLLGNHIQSLGLARQVRQLGLEVRLFTRSRLSVARYSNAVKRTYFFSDTASLYRMIVEWGIGDRNTLLFPTNDRMVGFLRDNYDDLNSQFYLGVPCPETIDLFYDKKNTYVFAEKHGIPAPWSYFPYSREDAWAISKEITDYPVVVKPAIMHSFLQKFGKKAFKCNNEAELNQKIDWIAEAGYDVNGLIIQEFLAGGAKSLYSYGTFAAEGYPVASLIANRIRQNPMDFGNSTTFARTCYIPEIQENAEKILRLTNYSGLAEVEFMYDEQSRQYKFLEINPRAWKWHAISNALGFSFIEKMIAHYNQAGRKEEKNFDTRVAWVERLTDFAVILKEVARRNDYFREALNSYKIPKEYAVWSPTDLKPFFMYLAMAPLLYFKRH